MNVSPRWRTAVVATAVLLAGVPPVGCVTETRTEQGGVVKVGPQRPKPPPRPPIRRDPNAPPLLLMYYAVNKHLPDRIDELATFADDTLPFKAECPESGQQYVYAPQGLRASTSGERSLIIYDEVPAHGGLRWGVFVAPPRDGQPPATWVILMSEEVFRQYVPQSQ
jgi:hypothetical protein